MLWKFRQRITLRQAVAAGGNITGEQSIASFVNTYSTEELPRECITYLTVTKQIAGELLESDLEREYAFVLTVDGINTEISLKAGESMTFEVPVGASYSVSEADILGKDLLKV